MRTFQCSLSGRTVIARDEWYGSYLAMVIGERKKPNMHRIDVRIIECIVPPSDRAILNPFAIVHRIPYEAGSIQNFDPTCIYIAKKSQTA